MEIHQQVAIVTGAAKGIGASISRAMAAAGARVVCADIDGDARQKKEAPLRSVFGLRETDTDKIIYGGADNDQRQKAPVPVRVEEVARPDQERVLQRPSPIEYVPVQNEDDRQKDREIDRVE